VVNGTGKDGRITKADVLNEVSKKPGDKKARHKSNSAVRNAGKK
jgi:pyruvate/2-oxoglutarate dehydrogenase complex dihydrolipoamide acyltransferase (E2) component